MILEQHYLGCLAQASYLIGDETTKTAVVVDPRRDVDVYLDSARAQGMTIRHAILTHIHADFIAGHLELRARAGTEIWLGARAEVEYPFTPVRDGDALDLGAVRLRFLETPGHTPESISILVFDLARDPRRPHAVLTGDTLFIGDVGRPDLMASRGAAPEELASQLYDSIHGKLLALPDETLLYPGHGAGSACGKSMSAETVSTIGAQRRLSGVLRIPTREEFVRAVTADQPEAPRYFAYDADLNRRLRPTLEETLERALRPLPLDEVLRLQNGGAQALDAREPRAFAQRHLIDSVNVPLESKYATYCGTVLDRERPIVILADPGREREAAMRLGRIGFDRVAGFLEGGPGALPPAPELTRSSGSEGPGEAARRLAGAPQPALLDVRTPAEFRQGRIGDALNLPLQSLEERAGEVPRGRPLLVYCRTGHRSSIAISLLERRGVLGAVNLEGGIEAWEKAGLEVSR